MTSDVPKEQRAITINCFFQQCVRKCYNDHHSCKSDQKLLLKKLKTCGLIYKPVLSQAFNTENDKQDLNSRQL